MKICIFMGGARRKYGGRGSKRNSPTWGPVEGPKLPFLSLFGDCVISLSSLGASSSLGSADTNNFAYVIVFVPVPCFQLLIGEFRLYHDSVFFPLSLLLLKVFVTIYEHEECSLCLHWRVPYSCFRHFRLD